MTNSTGRENPFGDALEIHPYSFDRPEEIANSLRGAAVLYNTYWVRFDRAGLDYARAVRNTRTLIDAAKQAGVRRIIHVSVTNPSEDSNLRYFRGKAVLERAVKESGISHAILRPAVLFGPEDILINNIAWMLRRFPLFGMFGDGSYQLQPIYVDDLAALAVEEGKGIENVTIDAIGPETFTYRELVEVIGRAVGKPRPIVHIPASLGWMIARLLGTVVGDVVVTREEIQGLMENRLCTNSPPAGTTRLTAWMADHSRELGRRYSSELARRRDLKSSYEALRTK